MPTETLPFQGLLDLANVALATTWEKERNCRHAIARRAHIATEPELNAVWNSMLHYGMIVGDGKGKFRKGNLDAVVQQLTYDPDRRKVMTALPDPDGYGYIEVEADSEAEKELLARLRGVKPEPLSRAQPLPRKERRLYGDEAWEHTQQHAKQR